MWIKPIKKQSDDGKGLVHQKITKAKDAEGVVVSVGEGRYLNTGEFIKAPVNEGDTVIYNPHIVIHETQEDGETYVIISSLALLGKKHG